ncbi:MAG: beta-lactamase family protein [Clostridia bacterium]|nr:beta-lactamase family protein [Clostridia bacterium]
MNFTKVDQFLTTLDQIGIAGTDLCIYLGGKLVHRHMNGLANREKHIPITENTLYRMFSMTKPITCVAMLQLYEQGKFLLTDPVSNFLPEFADMLVAHRHPATARSITMRQLFTMTSGLTYDLNTEPLTKLYREKPDFTTREFVQAVAKSPLMFQPGDHWYYSLAHDVLAACVEVISGMKFSEYLRKNIFEPLGIKDWYFWLPEHEADRSAVRYRFNKETKEFIRDETEQGNSRWNMYQRSPNFESGGAGLTTTVDEYAKFAMMMTNLGTGENGARILSRRTMEMMRENQLDAQQQHDFNWVQFEGYGYGLGVRTLISRAGSGSPGPIGEYGWGGAGGTYFIADPETKLTVLYAQEANPNNEAYVQPRLRNIIYACLDD